MSSVFDSWFLPMQLIWFKCAIQTWLLRERPVVLSPGALGCCSSCRDGSSGGSGLGSCISVSSPGNSQALLERRPGLDSAFCLLAVAAVNSRHRPPPPRCPAAGKVHKSSPSFLRNLSSHTRLSSSKSLGQTPGMLRPGGTVHCPSY